MNLENLTEKQIKNRKTLVGRFLIKHPALSVLTMMISLSFVCWEAVLIPITGYINPIKQIEYINNLEKNKLENYKPNTNYLTK